MTFVAIFVCPICKTALAEHTGGLRCTACDAHYPALDKDIFDFMPEAPRAAEMGSWQSRLSEMESWYRDLVTEPFRAATCFTQDYEPHAPILHELRGAIVDIGGGRGVVRHYLPPETRYLVIDPSLDWLRPEWTKLAPRFPDLATLPAFARGVGEHLPLKNGSFDGALSLWSLNHAADPERVVAEAARVLRPGGIFLIVLEEMEPTWADLFSGLAKLSLPRLGIAYGRSDIELVLEKSRMTWLEAVAHKRQRRSWPLNSDHVRIREHSPSAWFRDRFAVVERSWTGGYLRYRLQRL